MSPTPPPVGSAPVTNHPARRWAEPASALLLALWFVLTMSRGLEWFDSAELALVGLSLGVGHPPGQPGYTLLSALFGLGPWPALFGLNLLSALTCAACVWPVGYALRQVGLRHQEGLRFTVLLGLGAAAPLWDQASRIELYGPASLLWALILMLAHRRAAAPARRWFLPGLLTGLLATLNPLFAISAALGAGLTVLMAGRWRQPLAILARTGAAALGGLVGLLPYLQPVLAARDPTRFVWGDWQSAAGVWANLTGADYAHTSHSAWASVPTHALDWAIYLALQGALLGPLLGLVGAFLPKARPALPWLLSAGLLGVSFTFTYAVYHPEVPDYNGYLTPLLLSLALGLGALLAHLRPPLALAIALLTLSSAALIGERPLWQRSRAELGHTIDALARAWLNATPQDGVLIVESDHLVFPTLYVQLIDGHRPDVVLINAGFASSGWFWQWLYARHPQLRPFDLRAPSREVRLRRFLDHHPERSVRTESLPLATSLGLPACLDDLGARLGADCTPRPAQLAPLLLGTLLAGAQRHDPITPKVAARLALEHAALAWQHGDAQQSLELLAAGLTPSPPVPDDLPRAPGEGRCPQGAPPALCPPPGLSALPHARAQLIGSPPHIAALGAQLLEALGRPEAAQQWMLAVERER